MKKRPVRAELVEARTLSALRQAQGERKDFLLEIGCEELPAEYLPGALDWDESGGGLASAAAAAFSQLGVEWKELEVSGTARRLVLRVRGVAPRVKRDERGPPAQVAFDSAGRPTRAAEAFAGRHGLKVSQLAVRETPKGKVVFAEYTLAVEKVLAEAVPAIVGAIRFPKTMRWDSSGVRFARPIRWLVALLGSRAVPCAFGGARAGKVTQGSRRAGAKGVSLSSVSSYGPALSRLGVALADGRRLRRAGAGALEREKVKCAKQERIQSLLARQASALKGRLPDESTEEFEWLLSTVTFLAEEPVVQAGSFRAEYLELPPEVLATAMAKHLKLFSVRSPDGARLLPKFLAVLEGKPPRSAQVLANYERILEARFTDARFFYREDTKSRLEQKAAALDKVVFHEKLGSVADRIPRLERLMMALAREVKTAPAVSPDVLTREIRRAALLGKADLVTQMVREFPSLQGTIGSHYARGDGEPDAVIQGIAEQYRPRAAGDPVPATLLGALLGAADRLDTLLGYFGVGLSPTGSADPYGLRRQALGLARILIAPPAGASFVGLSIDRICDEGIQSWGSRLTVPAETVKDEVRAFLLDRFEWLCKWRYRTDFHLVDAVLVAGNDDLAGAWERLGVLRGFWGGSRDGRRRVLEQAAKVAERTARIVQSVKGMELPAQVDEGVLADPVEKELWAAWNRVSPQLKEQISRREYEEATRTYSTLYPTVHTFFEKVFVMDENLGLRRNRLALMKEIHRGLAEGFADLSKLPLAGVEPA